MNQIFKPTRETHVTRQIAAWGEGADTLQPQNSSSENPSNPSRILEITALRPWKSALQNIVFAGYLEVGIAHEVRVSFENLAFAYKNDERQEQERKILVDRESVEISPPAKGELGGGVQDDDAHTKTLELMKQGIPSIYGGTLKHGHWVATPDLFERIDGKSTFGDYYYVACDIKRSRHLKDEYCIQGSFYAEVLRLTQGRKPQQGYVMRPDGAVEAYALDEYATKFRLTLDGLNASLKAYPSRIFSPRIANSRRGSTNARETIADHLRA